MVVARRTVVAAAVTAVAAVALAACGERQDSLVASAQAGAAYDTVPPAPPPSIGGTSNGRTYGLNPTSLSGNTPDSRGTWKATRMELSGGDPAVVAAFNAACQAVVRRQLGQTITSVERGTAPWDFEAGGQVSFRSIAIAQVITGVSFYGAQSTSYVGTVVIDSRTARPVTFADLFANERTGLKRLSSQTKIILPKVNGWHEVMPDAPGNAPTAANFANWLPTADGVEIHFSTNQFGIAPPQTITVPWRELTDVLAPKMAALAKS